MKKIVIAGSREYDNYEEAEVFLDECLLDFKKQGEILILSGAARGADSLGERYAKENGFDIEYYPAEWKKYGRAAGLIRNKKMAESCDAAICFWNGKSKGTKSMIEYAKKFQKQIFIKKTGEK